MTGQQLAVEIVRVTLAVAAVLLMVFYLLVPALRGLRQRPSYLDTFERFALPVEQEYELELPAEAAGPGRMGQLEQARSDPGRAARVISAWLKDRR